MFFPFYGVYYNSYYMIGTIFVILAAILALWAQMKVTSTYSRYKKIANMRGISGAQVAREILDSEGLYDIQIYEVKGQLSDHYNPGRKTINLSSDIYHGTSIASLAVAAHECGHAIQYKEKYIPISLRNAILPIANVGQYLGMDCHLYWVDSWSNRHCLDWFYCNVWNLGFPTGDSPSRVQCIFSSTFYFKNTLFNDFGI